MQQAKDLLEEWDEARAARALADRARAAAWVRRVWAAAMLNAAP
jgi:hypothetical protein